MKDVRQHIEEYMLSKIQKPIFEQLKMWNRPSEYLFEGEDQVLFEKLDLNLEMAMSTRVQNKFSKLQGIL